MGYREIIEEDNLNAITEQNICYLDQIAQKMKQGDIVIFAGAGLSVASGYVNWKKLLEPISKETTVVSGTIKFWFEKKVLGTYNKDRVITYLSLAGDYSYFNRIDVAKECIIKAEEICKDIFESEDNELYQTVLHAKYVLGIWKWAIELLRNTMKIKKANNFKSCVLKDNIKSVIINKEK